MKRLAVNPFLRIFESDQKLVFYNSRDKTEFKGDLEFLLLLQFCIKGVFKEEAILFLKENSKLSLNESVNDINELIHSSILIDEEIFDSFSKKYSHWFTNNWEVLLRHLNATKKQISQPSVQSLDNYKKSKIQEYTKDGLPEFYAQVPASKDLHYLADTNNNILPKIENSVYKVFTNRRTCRSFEGSLSFNTLSEIMIKSFHEVKSLRDEQIEDETGNDLDLIYRSKYSAFECISFVQNIEGMERGAYRYHIDKQAFSLCNSNVKEDDIVKLSAGQSYIKNAPIILIITSIFHRYYFRHRSDNAYFRLLVDAGELGNEIILNSERLGVKCFQSPGMLDAMVENIFNLDPLEEYPLYMVALGND